MPPEPDVSHPGPQPAALHFPFAAATTALAAIDDAIAAVWALIDTHRDAVADARTDFQGSTRFRFDLAFEFKMIDLVLSWGFLQADRQELEAHIAAARTAVDARADAIGRWQSDMQVYNDAQAQPVG